MRGYFLIVWCPGMVENFSGGHNSANTDTHKRAVVVVVAAALAAGVVAVVAAVAVVQ